MSDNEKLIVVIREVVAAAQTLPWSPSAETLLLGIAERLEEKEND